MTQKPTEEELLDLARKYSFRSRIDSNSVAGPIMVWGRGSIVRDVNGKEYLDFNSGQMCGALGHNHRPRKLPLRGRLRQPPGAEVHR